MSTAATAGTLRVVLGADIGGLTSGLGAATASISSFGKSLAGALSAFTPSITSVVNAIGGQVKATIDAADHLNKMSQSTGLSTEELSKLKYAADLSDISTESLGKSMGKLSKAMLSAATDGAGGAAQAFNAMGVAVKNNDGTLRSQNDVLLDVAAKFNGYTDGAAKSALAITLFGKAGAGMIPLLNQGRDGLKEAGDEAEKYGLVLDKKTTIAAEAFNDNLRRMDMIKQGIVTTVTVKLLPTFEQLSEVMLEAKENSTLMSDAADVLGNGIKSVVTVALAATSAVSSFGGELSALWGVVKAFPKGPWSEEWVAAVERFNQAEKDTATSSEALAATLSRLWKNADNQVDWTGQLSAVRSMNKEVLAVADSWGKVEAPIVATESAVKSALQSFLDSQAKRIAGQNAEAATIGKSVGEQARLRIEYEAQAIALAKNITLGPVQLQQIAAMGNAAAQAAMKVAGAQATLQAMNPTEKYQLEMSQLKQLYDAGTISLETFGARQQQIAEQAGATWDLASASIAGSFATISGSFGKESKGMAVAAKVFGAIQGTISMFTGAAKALELPFPANLAAMAAVLAKGASLVASIKSQSIPSGYMTGGSFMVGGAGGPDSVPVSFMASPGEQVDIWRPDEGGGADPRGGGGRGGGPTTINLSVPIATTYDALRNVMDGINDMCRNGYRLNINPV